MILTKHEISLLKRIINTGCWEQMLWDVTYLVPSVALVVYGALNNSKRSIFVGIGVLAIIQIINIAQQYKSFRVFKGLCMKIHDLSLTIIPTDPQRQMGQADLASNHADGVVKPNND